MGAKRAILEQNVFILHSLGTYTITSPGCRTEWYHRAETTCVSTKLTKKQWRSSKFPSCNVVSNAAEIRELKIEVWFVRYLFFILRKFLVICLVSGKVKSQFPATNYWYVIKWTGTSKFHFRRQVLGWLSIDIVSLRLVVRTLVPGNLRMREENTKATVPLDAVPERRIKRCSPRFRPGGRFCELRFRYQSSPTGREGEISRPLDHMWQIPFIHSTQFIGISSLFIYNTAFQLFPPCGTS